MEVDGIEFMTRAKNGTSGGGIYILYKDVVDEKISA